MPQLNPYRARSALVCAGALLVLTLQASPSWAEASAPAAPSSAVASAPAASYRGLGAESLAPEVLARHRPPALPEDVSRQVQQMMDLRAPGLGMLSPDGKHYFFRWRVTGVDQVWRLDGPGRFAQQLTGGEDRTSLAGISPDGRWLALERDRKGEENPGLYLQRPDGGALVLVKHQKGVQVAFQGFSVDGAALYYTANDQRAADYAVYRFDLKSQQSSLLLGKPGTWRVADRRLGHLLLEKAVDSRSTEFFELDEASGALTPVLGQGEGKTYAMRYGAKPGQYLVLTPELSGTARLFAWSGGPINQATPVSAESRWEVSSFQLDAARQRIYVETNEAGYTRASAFDARTLKPLKLPFPADLYHQSIGAATPDGRFAVLGFAGGRGLPSTQVLDWKTGKVTEWIKPAVPEVDTSRFAEVKLEQYPARDGTPIPMLVRRAAHCVTAATPCPVIVHFHGGPEGQSRPVFSPVWQMFVDAGFVFVEPNVRGSTGYGKAWLDADNGPKRLNVITDIEDVAIYLRQTWAKAGVAPKVGVYGGSYGGYSALMAMTRFAGAFDAGVSNVGIANLLSFLENTAPYRRHLRTSEYGDPVRDREALIALSPTTYIDRLKAPLLIVQGVNDPRVPVGEAVQMYEKAKGRGVPLELHLYADEGHGASSRSNTALQLGHLLRFFQQHLK